MKPATLDVSLGNVIDAPRNANRLDPYRFEALREAIKSEGFLQPIFVREVAPDSFEIVDGHHRVRAAREVGLTSVPAVVVTCSDQDAARLAISLNRLRGELDLSEVSAIFDQLYSEGIAPELLAATGFTPVEVDALLAAAQKSVDEEVPRAYEAPPDDEAPAGEAVHMLELEFSDKKEMARMKRALKRVAGPDGKLGDAMILFVDGDDLTVSDAS